MEAHMRLWTLVCSGIFSTYSVVNDHDLEKRKKDCTTVASCGTPGGCMMMAPQTYCKGENWEKGFYDAVKQTGANGLTGLKIMAEGIGRGPVGMAVGAAKATASAIQDAKKQGKKAAQEKAKSRQEKKEKKKEKKETKQKAKQKKKAAKQEKKAAKEKAKAEKKKAKKSKSKKRSFSENEEILLERSDVYEFIERDEDMNFGA